MTIVTKDRFIAFVDDALMFNPDVFQEDDHQALAYVAWEGFKTTGKKGIISVNFSSDICYSAYFYTETEVFNLLSGQFYEKEKRLIDQDGFDRDLLLTQTFAPWSIVQESNPDEEILLLIRDPFNIVSELTDRKEEQAWAYLWVLHQFSKPTSEYHLEYIKSKESSVTKKPKKQQVEAELEHELYCWLLSKGIDVQRQVSTQKHRLDLWIPGKLMIELKAGKVSGDDICQAIDYHATYGKQILIIGKGMSDAASRGMDGFNKSTGDQNIVFVSWGAAKTYLSAVLRFS